MVQNRTGQNNRTLYLSRGERRQASRVQCREHQNKTPIQMQSYILSTTNKLASQKPNRFLIKILLRTKTTKHNTKVLFSSETKPKQATPQAIQNSGTGEGLPHIPFTISTLIFTLSRSHHVKSFVSRQYSEGKKVQRWLNRIHPHTYTTLKIHKDLGLHKHVRNLCNVCNNAQPERYYQLLRITSV